MKKKQRVVVSGMGVVTPIGIGLENYWDASLAGKSGVGIITSFDASTCPTKFAAEIKSEACELQTYAPHNDKLHLMPKGVQFGLAAVGMAMMDAGFTKKIPNPNRTGLVLGVTEDLDDYTDKLSRLVYLTCESIGAQKQVNTRRYLEYFQSSQDFQTKLLSCMPNYVIAEIASAYDICGPCFAVNTACSSGSQAIGDAFRAIQFDEADVMICGGTQSFGGPALLMTFSMLNTLSTRNEAPETASRPFDARRDGFVLGEGAGILILESLEHALNRGAEIHGEVIGFGAACDAYRVTDEHPDGRGAVQSMKNALRDAGLQPANVDYINAHGTSTPMNDRIETQAIKQTFGERAYRIPVSSSKSMLGHLIAAGGAVELITCLLAIRDRIVPPTINHHHPDPDCDLDYVPNQSREARVDIALSNSFGFGGQCNSIIVGRFDG
ncbi:MAG: beta-ketoacyl-[acyl-carrier-protein] synthase family protein [Desulfobacterales bacterium]|nr:MAG: beta-ketoacyl-[acyl-carrier-protein] synthase family protein [Desulfobacterales bacterium]